MVTRIPASAAAAPARGAESLSRLLLRGIFAVIDAGYAPPRDVLSKIKRRMTQATRVRPATLQGEVDFQLFLQTQTPRSCAFDPQRTASSQL